MARVIPYLLYEDVAAMLAWLDRAFGFEEKVRFVSPDDGRVSHAEMQLDGATVFMGDPGDEYRNPRRLGAVTQSLYVYVADVDAHCERARAAEAEIRDEPADQPYGDRRYSAIDPEGHHWFFAQHVRDVPPEAWGATTAPAD